MKPNYVLSHWADADLAEIARYTKHAWGVAQARKYQSQLRTAMEALASGKARGKKVGDRVPSMWMKRCEHHYIFCRMRPGKTPEIYAILHEKMDLMARIAERLG